MQNKLNRPMSSPVTRLHPTRDEVPLEGLYLAHDLRVRFGPRSHFVYTNFISSLDGHISEQDAASGRRRVPAALANPRDWRLYMELLAQCDVVLTTARHARAIAAGRQRELLSLQDADYADLAAWRQQRGLAPYPATAVLSNGLDFPTSVSERLPGGLIVLTGAQADPARVRALREAGVTVRQAHAAVDGEQVVAALAQLGYRFIYSIAGPAIMHTLLQAAVLDRIYLSLVPMLLAGEPFDTLTRGAPLTPPAGFRLHELYWDAEAPAPTGQLLLSLDRMTGVAASG